MNSTTIRVSRGTHTRLEELSRDEKKPIGQIVEQLIAEHEKQQFFQGLASDFRSLRENAPQWHDYQADLLAWDTTLLDDGATPAEDDEA